jgi:hypothetical protein
MPTAAELAALPTFTQTREDAGRERESVTSPDHCSMQ